MASDGRVLGINSAMAGASQASGFAIPVETAAWVVGELLARGKVQRAYLGVAVRTRPVPPRTKARAGLLQRSAVEILARSHGSAAQRADLRPQDLIVEINGQVVVDAGSLHRVLRKVVPGQRVKVGVLREGVKLEREVVAQSAAS